MPDLITRRHFLGESGKTILGAGLAGTLLYGCGGGSDGGEGPLTLWAEVEGARTRDYWNQQVKAPFEEAHPNIELELTFQSGQDLNRNMRTAMQSGEGPDLVPTPGTSYALQFINASLLREMDQYAEQYGWQDKILEWALDSGRYNGNLYSIPIEFETMLFYFNKSLFEENGWTPPANRDELEALAEEAMGQDIIPFGAGNASWRPATEWLMTVFWNHFSGPEALYQALMGEIPWTDPVFVDAVELLNQYFQKGWFGGSVQQYFSNSTDDFHAQLGNGTAAMNMEGSWFIYEVDNFFGRNADNDNEWDWTPLPSLSDDVPDSLYELGIGSTLSINNRTENPEEAARYIDWYFSEPENGANWSAEIPALLKPANVQSENVPESMDERVRRLISDLSSVTSGGGFGYTTWTFWPPKTNTFVYEGIENVLTGNMKPDEYCAELDGIFREELEADEVPSIFEPGAR